MQTVILFETVLASLISSPSNPDQGPCLRERERERERREERDFERLFSQYTSHRKADMPNPHARIRHQDVDSSRFVKGFKNGKTNKQTNESHQTFQPHANISSLLMHRASACTFRDPPLADASLLRVSVSFATFSQLTSRGVGGTHPMEFTKTHQPPHLIPNRKLLEANHTLLHALTVLPYAILFARMIDKHARRAHPLLKR